MYPAARTRSSTAKRLSRSDRSFGRIRAPGAADEHGAGMYSHEFIVRRARYRVITSAIFLSGGFTITSFFCSMAKS